MSHVKRPLPFVLISSNHGSLIVNRNDYRMVDESRGYGVGFQLLTHSCFDQEEVELVISLIDKRHHYFGDGVVAIDCGANIGVHTVEWAKFMHGWGAVYSFEAQEKIFYALAGNIALNNCLNVTARHCAVGSECSTIKIPEPNYLIPSSYGSLELIKRDQNEFIGQPIDYVNTKEIPLISIDSLNLNRVDFIKIDVEGMEEDVLSGAEESISRSKPILIVENIKSDQNKLNDFFVRHGYLVCEVGINTLAIHESDPTLQDFH